MRASDAIGEPLCVNVVAYDPVAKQAIYTRKVHTGVGLNLTTLDVGHVETAPAQPAKPPPPDAGGATTAGGGSSIVGVVAGGVAGGLVLACAASGGVLLYRRKQRHVTTVGDKAASAAGARTAGGGRDEELATIPSKPPGSGPMTLASLLAQTESGSQPPTPPTPEFFFSYVTSVSVASGAAMPDRFVRRESRPRSPQAHQLACLPVSPDRLPAHMHMPPSLVAAAVAVARHAAATALTTRCTHGRWHSPS